jgi:hypothetical protein
MNKTRNYIRTLLLVLLLGGMGSEAWAATVTKKITYHVITLPFGSAELTGGDDAAHKYRIEALKKEETYTYDDSDASTIPVISLPSGFKSPLLEDDAYSYYYKGNSGVTEIASQNIFPNSPLLFNVFSFSSDDSKKLAADAKITDIGDAKDIYVTYDWEGKKSALAAILPLDGPQLYNIEFVYKSGKEEKHEFFAMNMDEPRGNRAQGIPFEYIKSPFDLSTDGPHKLIDGTSDETKTYFHYTWLLVNNDPYNIILETAYAKDDAGWGDFTYKEETVPKKSKRARFYGRVNYHKKINNTEAVEKNSWMNNEWGYGWYEGSGNTPVATPMPGWFRGTGVKGIGTNGVQDRGLYFSFALLKRTEAENDFTLLALCSNTNASTWVPNESGHYLHLGRQSGKYPGPYYSSFADADRIILHDIQTYTFKVKTPFYDDTKEPTDPYNLNHVVSYEIPLSEHYEPYNILEFIPDALKRKYVTIEGAYKEAGLTNAMTTFADVEAAKNGRVIWLKYTAAMPFEALPKGGSYTDATWYTIRMNGDVEWKNLGYLDDTGNYFYTGLGSSDDLHEGENDSKAQFAFIGDPYELKIISRKASETDGANRYVGCATGASNNTTLTSQTGTSDISTWEIVYETTQPGNMILREFKTAADPHYIGWAYGTANKPMVYSTTSNRIRVVDLALKQYTYHIVRADGSIAAKATTKQEYGVKLDYNAIPEIIRSPFLALDGVTLTFYWTKDDAQHKTNAKTNGSYSAADANENDIYVRYDMGTALNSAPGSYITGAKTFNLRVNGEYIYYDSGTIKSTLNIVDEVNYHWILGGSDPYAMTIKSAAAGKYVTVADWDTGTVSWSDNAPTSKFIVKSGTQSAYEVMAATGDGKDASETYYNFGRVGDDPLKMHKNEGIYLHGYDAIRFYFDPLDAVKRTYHLIDLKGKDLLQVDERQDPNGAPHFPDEYRSPLVPERGYHYWLLDDFDVTADYFGTRVSKYTLKSSPKPSEVTKIEGHPEIYVTYDIGSQYDMINKKDMFLLKFETGTPFRAEDGNNGLEDSPVMPVYPYCNGDCNFFVYGQDQFDLQQQGAASTRTRWAWYLESDDNDPYHVKICSRQTDTYNNDEVRAYFCTYQPSGYDKVVTNLVWPSISGLRGTEYMILGTNKHYRLTTTETVPLDKNHDGTPESNMRRTVNSFEQYWKTYDTVKNILLKGILEEGDKGANPSGSILVPYSPTSYRELLTGTGEGQYGFHSYNYWAYAKRFNGYNISGKASKGWEEVEHWFQTVQMGEGYFDLIPIEISPVLILLDQHGWEIMRKPLPNGPDDKKMWAKYDEIRPYDSPMVKEYYFWTKSSKRSGFHQYYKLDQQVTVAGQPYTSTSLTSLPPYDAKNVKDAKGNLLDQYVTYTVKDEYVQSLSVSYATESARDDNSNVYTRIKSVTGTGIPFLIQQGDKFASVASAEATSVALNNVPTQGGMSKYIIDNIGQLWTDGDKKNELWYLMPNFEIDNEMGYSDPTVVRSINWVNDYRDMAKVQESGFDSWAFDPYNIQITSVPYTTKYFVTNATGGSLEDGEGSIVGSYSGAATMSLGATQAVSGTWHDSRTLTISNATFMAVQDADGNMQLMPRFDQTRRVKDFGSLVSPKDAGIEQTYTQLFHPFVYNYIIVDNEGRESLRYKSGGELVPQTPDHFKSPLAKEYTYYKALAYDSGTGIYTEIKSDGISSSKVISASLVGANLKTPKVGDGNQVYVRYEYDKEADVLNMLQGKWLTMKLNEKDVQYTSEPAGIYADADTPTKPATINSEAKSWQWKFLETPQSDHDPYAVKLFNRANTAKTALPAAGTRFALLSHEDGGYALAVAGTGSYTGYSFLNGTSMASSVAATTAVESGFRGTSCDYSGKGSQIVITDEVEHTYNYCVYTDGGELAVQANQDFYEATDNDFVPVIPHTIKTPLLGNDKFRYYENLNDTAYATGHRLTHLYGLYDDVIYVRYNAYDPKACDYKVPNVKGTDGTHVTKGSTSNDSPLRINGKMPYNIIWYNDNMMMTNAGGITIGDGGSHVLDAANEYKWYLDGSDPYAIKIKNKSGKFVYTSDNSTCSLNDDASTFMLLPKDGYDYGVLRKTGTNKMLTGYGSTLTASDPTQFIIFAMATYDVIYHLIIAKIGETVTIDYKAPGGSLGTKTIQGSTMRDLKSDSDDTHSPGDKYQLGETVNGWTYCQKVGPISLGDELMAPDQLKRRNCKYFYYVEGIYSNAECTTDAMSSDATPVTLNSKYKGLQIDDIAADEDLIHTYVRINVEYQFDDGLHTNSGSHFVTDVGQNKWYTFETVRDDNPWLAQFTNAWGIEIKEGRGTHYTNDYLWTPIGDPYGFKMYNRYTYMNSGAANTGEKNRIMTTEAFAAAQKIIMSDNGSPSDIQKENAVWELLAESTTTDGYFLIHPVVNALPGTQYYLGIVEGDDDGDLVTNIYLKLSTTPVEMTFGLTTDLVKPYYDRAGYVGGLTTTPKAGTTKVKSGKELYEDAAGDLMALQNVVYDLDNIVEYTHGYYRLHSPSDIDGVTERYASGYNHLIEATDATPMHFYERKGVNTTYEILGSGYNFSAATRGALPISAPEYDPASIISFTQVPEVPPFTTAEHNNPNMALLSTQGLYVKSIVARGGKEYDYRKNAIMTDTKTAATPLYVMDIGGAIMLIHDNYTAENRAKLKYLSFDQLRKDSIYDLKLTHNTHTDHAKWLLEPANDQGLKVTTNVGGDGYYYATFCAPYDVLLKGAEDAAYICKQWETDIIHLKKIGKYNTGTNVGNDKFIPAGTPVIIRTPTVGDVSMSLPGTVSSSISECIFSGKYLEQKLDGKNIVYTFGLPYASGMTLNTETGVVTSTHNEKAVTGVGFYINANPNKELGLVRDSWIRNNRYVLHNKIYYREGSSGASSRELTRSPEFIPVVFDDDDEEEDEPIGESLLQRPHDNRVYDLLGRCVASGEEVVNGTWRHKVASGIYILNGRKIYVK